MCKLETYLVVAVLCVVAQGVWADYASEVAADNPLDWWRLNEPAGSTVFTNSGSRATVMNAVNSPVAGVSSELGLGTAVSFNGVDQSLDSATANLAGQPNDTWYTIELWVKLDSDFDSKSAIYSEHHNMGEQSWSRFDILDTQPVIYSQADARKSDKLAGKIELMPSR